MYVKHLVVVTQQVWYICFVLFSKCFCLIKKPWFNGSIFPFLFYPHFSGICLKHTVNYSDIRAFRCNGEFQLLQKEGILLQTSGVFLLSRSRMEIRLPVNSIGWLKTFYFIDLQSKIKANHWQHFFFESNKKWWLFQ